MESNSVKKTAFVVDDNSQAREHYAISLEREGFKIDLFANEAKALAALKKKSPHVAIVHFSEDMARTVRFIAKMHGQDPTISILYITYYGGEQLHSRAVAAGAYRVLEKPISLFADRFNVILKEAFEESKKRKRFASGKHQVFVLMPFAKKFDELYRLAIKEPLEKLGYRCERVDEIQFTGDIIEKVYNKIEQSDLVVADMTGKNPNVFYEVGYAHALGKTVILLTQNANDIPFDLHGQRHIVYGRSMLKLRDELSNTVKALADI